MSINTGDWNADDWLGFLTAHCDSRATSPNGLRTVALRIAETIDAIRASVPADASHAQLSQLDDASNACLELAAKHGFATGHGDTVADMIREFSAQIKSVPADAGMTYGGIEAAFTEHRKTLTVMDKPASFDSFSQGYVSGWNAAVARPLPPSNAVREALVKAGCVSPDGTYIHASMYEVLTALPLSQEKMEASGVNAGANSVPPSDPANR